MFSDTSIDVLICSSTEPAEKQIDTSMSSLPNCLKWTYFWLGSFLARSSYMHKLRHCTATISLISIQNHLIIKSAIDKQLS